MPIKTALVGNLLGKVWEGITKKRYIRECPQGGHEQIGGLFDRGAKGEFCKDSNCVEAMVERDSTCVYKNKEGALMMAVVGFHFLARYKGSDLQEWYDLVGENYLKILEEEEGSGSTVNVGDL